ncbi:hypothetical protein B0J11DRAFT_192975 [Dendryphion nanum]|uniref:Uncharacterized protein n=1 Tax=Dendryphion nanum TaxID=256645 RepID=A0A9P9I7Y4_9PLEO|nr:hypothetical protein B0J11DRAFT_192975 [Dendryphion nanum]
MSMHQQSNCQNLACRVLYKQLEELCKAVEAAQAIINIIQPIINSQRPLWMPNPDLTPLNTDDGNQSDLDDDDHEETGTENLHCPHSQCKDKESYSNRESLKRHFTNHVGCKTKCRSCGIEIDTVRRYALHFKTCMKGKLSGQPLLNAKKEQRKLNKRATKELDKMCSQSTELGDLDITGNAKKRKDTDTTSPSLRPRLGTSENLASNAFFTSAATEAGMTSTLLMVVY